MHRTGSTPLLSVGIQSQDAFIAYNRFYRRKDCAGVVYALYRGQCQCCGRVIDDIKDMEIGHRVPRAHANVFEEAFPKLDVDNLLNLQPEHMACNRSKRHSHVFSPTLLQAAVDHAARLIVERLPKILADVQNDLLVDTPNDLAASLGVRGKVDLRPAVIEPPEVVARCAGDCLEDVLILDADMVLALTTAALADKRAVSADMLDGVLDDALIEVGEAVISVLTDGQRVFSVGSCVPTDGAGDQSAWYNCLDQRLFQKRNEICAFERRRFRRSDLSSKQRILITHRSALEAISDLDIIYRTHEEEECIRIGKILSAIAQAKSVAPGVLLLKGLDDQDMYMPEDGPLPVLGGYVMSQGRFSMSWGNGCNIDERLAARVYKHAAQEPLNGILVYAAEAKAWARRAENLLRRATQHSAANETARLPDAIDGAADAECEEVSDAPTPG